MVVFVSSPAQRVDSAGICPLAAESGCGLFGRTPVFGVQLSFDNRPQYVEECWAPAKVHRPLVIVNRVGKQEKSAAWR